MSQNPSGKNILPFAKRNYLIMGGGVGLILLGYFIMSTEKFIDASKFSLSLYICPFLILAGLVLVGLGIMAKTNNTKPTGEQQ